MKKIVFLVFILLATTNVFAESKDGTQEKPKTITRELVEQWDRERDEAKKNAEPFAQELLKKWQQAIEAGKISSLKCIRCAYFSQDNSVLGNTKCRETEISTPLSNRFLEMLKASSVSSVDINFGGYSESIYNAGTVIRILFNIDDEEFRLRFAEDKIDYTHNWGGFKQYYKIYFTGTSYPEVKKELEEFCVPPEE